MLSNWVDDVFTRRELLLNGTLNRLERMKTFVWRWELVVVRCVMWMEFQSFNLRIPAHRAEKFFVRKLDKIFRYRCAADVVFGVRGSRDWGGVCDYFSIWNRWWNSVVKRQTIWIYCFFWLELVNLWWAVEQHWEKILTRVEFWRISVVSWWQCTNFART